VVPSCRAGRPPAPVERPLPHGPARLVIATGCGLRGSSCLGSTSAGLRPRSAPGWPPAASAGSLGRAPPFFRTSAGPRREGRPPWHRPGSRQSAARGDPMATARSCALAAALLVARLLGCSAREAYHPRSPPQAWTAGLPALASPQGRPDMTTAPNGEGRRQDLHLPGQQLVSRCALPWVPWVSLPHRLRDDALLRLPPPRLGALHLALASPIPCLLPCVRGVPCGLVARAEAPDPARAFRHPVPHSGHVVKETSGSPKFPSYPCGCMPRSQTPVVSSTLALPRPGLLPSGACKPSAFPSIPPERYPLVHDYTHFGAQSRGLRPRYTRLRTAPCGEARGCATDRLARR
jgi:hypothetical protein